MEPKPELNAVQLLDATIERMIEAGPDRFNGDMVGGEAACVLKRAGEVLGCSYTSFKFGVFHRTADPFGYSPWWSAMRDPRLVEWDRVSTRLYGEGVELVAIHTKPYDAAAFDELIGKLRTIKAML